MTTEEIIADLRQNELTSASIYTRMERAANRLEELQRANKNTLADLALAVSERDETVADLIKQRDVAYRRFSQQITATPPEPSRLEIAAMLVAGRFSSTSYVTEVKGTWIKYALEGADALIAAAREGK